MSFHLAQLYKSKTRRVVIYIKVHSQSTALSIIPTRCARHVVGPTRRSISAFASVSCRRAVSPKGHGGRERTRSRNIRRSFSRQRRNAARTALLQIPGPAVPAQPVCCKREMLAARDLPVPSVRICCGSQSDVLGFRRSLFDCSDSGDFARKRPYVGERATGVRAEEFARFLCIFKVGRHL